MSAIIDNTEIQLPRHHLSLQAFHKMGEAGILDEDARVELVEGELIDMAPIGSLHAGTVDRLARLFFERCADVIVRVQNPIVLGSYSELQPDLSLVRPREDNYTKSHPEPPDVLLVVEVGDSTVRYDREIKIPLYAQYGIPEVWLLDLQNQQLEVYLQPGANGYRQILRPAKEEEVVLSCLTDVVIDIAELFVK